MLRVSTRIFGVILSNQDHQVTKWEGSWNSCPLCRKKTNHDGCLVQNGVDDVWLWSAVHQHPTTTFSSRTRQWKTAPSNLQMVTGLVDWKIYVGNPCFNHQLQGFPLDFSIDFWDQLLYPSFSAIQRLGATFQRWFNELNRARNRRAAHLTVRQGCGPRHHEFPLIFDVVSILLILYAS